MAMRLDHGTDELGEVHGINVTPFIDVMLVLLIIFMVAAPLATVDIAVDLPPPMPSRNRNRTNPSISRSSRIGRLPSATARLRAISWRARSTVQRAATRKTAFSCAPIAACPMAT